MTPQAPPAEHVVMLVVNDVVNDSRVLREAAWLARAGLRVTVLGVTSAPARDVVAVDRVLVVRLPLSGAVSAARSDQMARRRAWRPLRPARAETGVPARPDREHADRGAARLLRRARRAARRRADLVTDLAADRLDAALAGGWEAYDRWRSTDGRLVRWQSVVGGLVADYEATFGPVLDELAPDVVHAHDVHVLGVAVHAARRADRARRTLRVVYDAHEFVPGMAVAGRRTARTNAGWRGFEEQYVRHADAVVTVGHGIAGLIQQVNGLPERPAVVLNVPVPTPGGGRSAAGAGDVRAGCGLARDVPLMVYSGTLSAVRGVDTAVQALADLPGVHLAVVCVPRATGPVVEGLREQARALGCEDRLHLLPPVGPGEVVRYLATADVGLITMHGGWPNHENAMPNKFFEYLRAGVPLVVTDLQCLGGEVRSGGLGATFASADPVALAAAVRSVLADLPGVRARVAASPWRVEGDWRVQEVRLRAVYERLLGRDLAGPPAGADTAGAEDLATGTTPEGRPLDPRPLALDELPAAEPRPQPPLLLVGPADHDGSARALAAAVRGELPDLRVEVSAINPTDPHGVDRPVRRATYHRSLAWQLEQLRSVLREASFVLLEDGGPLAGSSTGGSALRELTYLTSVGARCGVLLHRLPHDAFRDRLEEVAALGVALLADDPALAAAVPGGRWLPLVLPDEARRAQGHLAGPAGAAAAGARSGPPVVAAADRVARTLLRAPAAAGEVRLHQGPVDDLGVPSGPERVDAVVLGALGPGSRAAVRAMASGLVVVAGAAGPGPWLPLADADGDPGWHRLADPAALAPLAAAGPAWVCERHAGPASVEVLRRALGLGVRPAIGSSP